MHNTFRFFIIVNLITLNCIAQSTESEKGDPVFTEYSSGYIKDGYNVGVWEYYDLPGELSISVNYDNGKLLYLIPDTSEYVIKVDDRWVSSKLDIQPRYIGSMVEFYKILYKNTTYPKKARENSIVGKFYITFEVDTLGHAGEYEVIHDIGGECSKEIIRTLKLIPNFWLSAMKDKRKYVAKFILPINFTIEIDGKVVNDPRKAELVETNLPIAKSLDMVLIRAMAVKRTSQSYMRPF